MTVTINITVQLSVSGAERDALIGYWERHRLAEPAQIRQESASAIEIRQSAVSAIQLALPEAAAQAEEILMIEQGQGAGIALGDRVLNESLGGEEAILLPLQESGSYAARQPMGLPSSRRPARSRTKMRKNWKKQRIMELPSMAKSGEAAKLRAARDRFVKACPHRRILNKQARPIGPPQGNPPDQLIRRAFFILGPHGNLSVPAGVISSQKWARW